MAVVKIKTPSVSENIRTTVATDYSSGTSITVESSSGFSNGDYIVVGEPGLDTTEVTHLTAVPGTTTMTIASLSYPHQKGTPVYYTRWDKYSLEYRASSTDSWAAYGSMPLALQFNAIFTEYRDTSAAAGYQWRYRYYSTENTVYSDYSDTINYTGWSEGQVGYMVREIRKIINDPDSKTVSDAELIRYLNKAQNIIYTLYDRWWFLLKEGTAIDTVADTASYSLPSDFGRMHTVLYRYVSGDTDTTYPLKFISLQEYDYQAQDNDASTDDHVKYFTLMPGDASNTTGYLKIWPKPTTAGLDITPRYYKTFTALDSYGDTTEVPVPAILEDYAIAQSFLIRGEEKKGQYYDKLFREQIELLKLMQRKQVGPPRFLWQWKGRKAVDRLYGGQPGYSDTDNESYW